MGMYKRLAVALDGSSEAEKILPVAVQLAKILDGEILLLHVCLEPKSTEETIHTGSAEAVKDFKPQVYLDRVKERLTQPPTTAFLAVDRVQTRVIYGKLAYELGDFAASEGADLLLMTTHGRSGLSLLTMGSIATGVLKHSRNPLLLLRPVQSDIPFEEMLKEAGDRPPNEILLTLDGTPKAEAALEPALKLASELNIPLHLVEVIYPTSPIIVSDPLMDYQMLTEIQHYEVEALTKLASKYLTGVRDWLKERSPSQVVKTSILKGLPDVQLTAFAHEIKPFIVVMATHARNELGQLFLGSVAEEVLRQIHLPVLMVPIPKGFKGYGLQVEDTDKTEGKLPTRP